MGGANIGYNYKKHFRVNSKLIKKLVSENKIEEAILQLGKSKIRKEFKNDVVVIKRQLSSIKDRSRKHLISIEDKDIAINKICYSLISIAESIPFDENSRDSHKGYCIRTGVEIPFNPDRPLSYEAFLEWSMYENIHYEENYCHFSGEESFGETSFDKPIMYKNWTRAKRYL